VQNTLFVSCPTGKCSLVFCHDQQAYASQ
jgi:hypothetical protein